MIDMFCPACHGPLIVCMGSIMTQRRWGREYDVAEFVACAMCPLVSEVNPVTGGLPDLNTTITIGDLNTRLMQAPIIQSPATILHGRDS